MKKYLSMIPLFLISGALGYFGAEYILNSIDEENFILSLFSFFICFIITYLLQLILHEAGHLVFGLMTGYKFLSYRIGSFTIQEEEGQLKLKKFNLAGTAGQCILCAPELKDNNFPFVLYNLGGIIMNLILGIVSIVLFKYVFKEGIINTFFVLNAFSAILMFVTNGIPARVGGVANDGYNTMDMIRDHNAAIAFWKQLKINELQTKGVPLDEMNPDYFEVEGNYHNVLISAILVFKENRLMVEKKFDQAKELIDFLFSKEVSIIGIYEELLKNDLMYISILNHEDYTFNKAHLRFRKSMKDFPSIIRTDIAMKLKEGKDITNEINHFEKVLKTYPIKADIESERELIEVVRNVYM